MAEKKKKRFFLVDYENVHKGGLYGVEKTKVIYGVIKPLIK